MAQQTIDGFTTEDVTAARIMKALSHPARIAIVRLLASRASCICGDIVDELPLAQATVSQHLRELKEAGIVQGTISGPKVCYCLNPEGWAHVQRIIADLATISPYSSTSCC
jgi:predicted transcriptional regulator